MEKKRNQVFQVIFIFGIISMLGDIVYESARGVNSQYLQILSISASQIGLVFGIGEFLGYFLRLFAGLFSDKTGKHWIFVFLGYGSLLVVPLMGFTDSWILLIILMLAERIGKALRSPAKDTILSTVADGQMGVGIAFGIQEALDQIGAFVGPLIFTAVFYFTQNNRLQEYQRGYQLLLIPFVLLMLFLYFAYRKITDHQLLPTNKENSYQQEKLQDIFWIYTAFTFFASLGFMPFPIIAYHLKFDAITSDASIPLIYAFAMAIDAIVALLIGWAYDQMKKKTKRKEAGILVLGLIPLTSLLLVFFALQKSFLSILLAMLFFGITMASHETVMRSAIADLSPFHKRGLAYGIFNTCYGLALLLASVLMGYFYEKNIHLIWIFALVVEVISFLLFIYLFRRVEKTRKA